MNQSPRWFIFFDDSTAAEPLAWRLFQPFLRADRRHVACLIDCGGSVWLVVELTLTGGTSKIFSGIDAVAVLKESGCRVLELDPNREIDGRPYWRGFLTCVSFVKIMAGLRRWWVITPAQLERELLATGRAVEV